jgi:hypothetical protein
VTYHSINIGKHEDVHYYESEVHDEENMMEMEQINTIAKHHLYYKIDQSH